MEHESEEIPDFSPFSRIGRIPLDPESVVGKELVENFEQLDESFTGKNKSWSAIVKLIALSAMCVKGVIDLEKQVIDLRREVRSHAET
ncbi:hypothetical protein ABQF33_15470 [Mycolicibacterium sp. XJ2]